MPENTIKAELIRAQTEARLAPMLRLRRRQLVLLGVLPLYFLFVGMTLVLKENATYGLLMLLMWILSILYGIQVVRFSLDFYHESVVQCETKKAMELERLRLLHALATAEDAALVGEKAKRSMRLSDDGELIPEESDVQDVQRGRLGA